MADVTVFDSVTVAEFESELLEDYTATVSVATKPIGMHSVDAIPFAANLRSDNIAGCQQIKAAPGSGSHLIVQSVLMSTDTALEITIGEGVAGSGITTTLLGPIKMAANQRIPISLTHSILMTANTALVCDANSSGNVNIFVEGYVV